MEILIREAMKDEWNKVPAIYERDGHTLNIEKIRTDAQKEFNEIGEKRIVWFAELNGRVEGLVHLIFNYKEKDLANGDDIAYIHHFRVSYAHHGKKIASKLMQVLENEARKRRYKFITLEVDLTNIRAYTIYKHWGFKYFRQGENSEEIAMRKSL